MWDQVLGTWTEQWVLGTSLLCILREDELKKRFEPVTEAGSGNATNRRCFLLCAFIVLTFSGTATSFVPATSDKFWYTPLMGWSATWNLSRIFLWEEAESLNMFLKVSLNHYSGALVLHNCLSNLELKTSVLRMVQELTYSLGLGLTTAYLGLNLKRRFQTKTDLEKQWRKDEKG